MLENKRLNEVHKAILPGMSSGFDADGVMSLASNAVHSIDIDSLPKPVARLVLKIRDSGGMGNSSQYLMHMGIAAKLMTRLVRAGILSDEQREILGDLY